MLGFFASRDRRRELEREVIQRHYRRGRRWTVWCSSLFYGAVAFVFLPIFDFVRHSPTPLRLYAITTILSLPMWLAVGYAQGAWQWRFIEKKMQSLTRKQ
jgi:hypothetical protein